MHIRLRPLSFMWLPVYACLVTGCTAPEPADLLITNAVIYTLDDSRPRAEAMVVRDGRILALGSNNEIRTRFNGTERDARGAMVLPGFHDAHVHPLDAGIDFLRCNLSESETVAALLATVAGCDAGDPGTGWLLGYGWSLALFENGNPHRSLLDGVSTQRPILLEGADGHSTWANSLAFERAGVDADTPAPALGIIERDADGVPSGTLRETARALLLQFVPGPGSDELAAALVNGVAVLNSYGITSMIEANASSDDLAVYRKVDTAGDLNIRAVVSQTLNPDDYIGQINGMVAASNKPGDMNNTWPARVRGNTVKIFLDGVLEGETAALLEPYLTSTATTRVTPRGRLTIESEKLEQIVTAFDTAGIQVHVHAIGDRAVQTVLDAFAAARRSNGSTYARHHVAHLQLVDPADYGRFAQLDVTANFQAVWAFPDDYIMKINLPQLGPERVARMYPVGSLARAGARIVGGSDWNVSTANPLVAIEVALTRQDPSGRRSDVLNAEEAVDLETMLRAYTVNGAWLMHQENVTGKLAPGFAADFVMLERNLFEIPASEIGEVGVLATYLDGIVVFDASDSGD